MFSKLLSKSLSLALLIFVGTAGDGMAAEPNNRQLQVSRTYNYNWQSEILVKHPNAAHFNWTPMTVTRARVKSGGSGGSILPRYRNTKPKVVAWNSLRRPAASGAAASTTASVSGRVGSASETYGTSAALSYDNVSAQLQQSVSTPASVAPHTVGEGRRVEGRLLRYGNSY
ncbi:MAG: hypothetical protein SFV17_03100 [Candidatus Obscuribacter sp.]|nr:hypothetical protein [Candidatus Melainabacteria bacterium]MDX1985652.1 hypothetical protein [Candidatus Obscuribacter sp.]